MLRSREHHSSFVITSGADPMAHLASLSQSSLSDKRPFVLGGIHGPLNTKKRQHKIFSSPILLLLRLKKGPLTFHGLMDET